MKKIVFLVFSLIVSLSMMGCGQNNIPSQETNAERIIGVWNLVGESEDTDSGEHLYEYYDAPVGYGIFYEDGKFIMNFDDSIENYTYVVEEDSFIKLYDEKGEYDGYDLKISWQGEELILSEYWRQSHYDKARDDFVRSEDSPYDEEDDHDFIILRRTSN